MSKPSKNMPVPISSMMRRWNLEMGSRSRRAPGAAVTVSSLLPHEQARLPFVKASTARRQFWSKEFCGALKKSFCNDARRKGRAAGYARRGRRLRRRGDQWDRLARSDRFAARDAGRWAHRAERAEMRG